MQLHLKLNFLLIFSVLYRNIYDQNCLIILQNDLDTISSWVEKWLMELNINNFVVLSITFKHNPSSHHYNILGTTLRQVTKYDYLDVTMSSDINWLSHVTQISIKSSRTLVYLRESYPPVHKM